MTKRDLVVRISKETGMIQQDVFAVIQKSLDYISETLAEGSHIEFRDFGVFDICLRKERIGRNPNEPKKTVVIPAHKVVRFRPGKKMKELIANS
jgi:nucleoid DNA-binding protein